MKRLFIAIDISEEARKRASAYVDELRHEFRNLRVGWERPEKLHLTLKFLGDSDEMQLGLLRSSLKNAAAAVECFDLKLAGTGVFPKRSDPRILWLGVQEEGTQLAEIASQIEELCGGAGFARESRTFCPHLTIGRVRRPAVSHQLAEKHLSNQFGPIDFSVREIVLYESRLNPAGSVYTKEAVFPLRPV